MAPRATEEDFGGIGVSDRLGTELHLDRIAAIWVRPNQRPNQRAETIIAERAAELVPRGATVFVDSGARSVECGRRLLRRRGVTLYTNSIPLLCEVPAAGCRLLSIGGELRRETQALVGAEAFAGLGRLRFDFAFFGADGIDVENGPCADDLGDAGIKTAALELAGRAVLLADAAVWQRPAAVRFADWPQIDAVITDREFSARERAFLAERGVAVHFEP